MSSLVKVVERYGFCKSTTKGCTGSHIEKYWKDLLEADLLKYRMPDRKNPDLRDVYGMLKNKKVLCFAAVDRLKQEVCGDVMLTNFEGLAAQAHFSVHPDYRGLESIRMGKAGVRFLLDLKVKGEPMLTTLIGLTPERNRLAIWWTRKVGYKYKCILTNACRCAYDSEEIQNAVVHQITSEDI